MSSQSPFTRTLVAIAAALAMSTVAVGAAVGPAQADRHPVRRSPSMPELEILEAKVPVRTPRLVEVETEPATARLAPVAGLAQRSGVQPRPRHFRGEHDRASRPGGRPGADDPDDHPRDGRDAGRGPRDGRPLDRRHQGDAARGAAGSTSSSPTGPPRPSWRCRKDRDDLAKAALVERQKAAEMADEPARRARPDRAGAARLRGRHRQASGQAARSPRPPECDRGAVRKRGHPGQGARDHARQPHRRTRSPSSSCSSAAPTSPKAARCARASPASKTRSTSSSADEKIDAELEAMKAALESARELKEEGEDDDGPQDLSVLAGPQGREDRRRLLDARQR